MANKHVRITGTYTGSDELTLTGSITGASWNGTTTIEFTFNSNGSTTVNDNSNGGGNNTNNQDNLEEGDAPEVGAIYKDCYVLSTEEDDSGEYVTATLVHKLEMQIAGSQYTTQQELETEINSSLSSFDTNGITGWRLPTQNELSSISLGLINTAFENVSGATSMGNYFYYFSDGANIKCGSLNANNFDMSYEEGERLRPVTTVMFKK